MGIKTNCDCLRSLSCVQYYPCLWIVRSLLQLRFSLTLFGTAKSSNPAHVEVYSMIQHYVIKFVCELRRVNVFFPGTPSSSTNKTDRYDITQTLLKVALNSITLTQNTTGTGTK